MMILKTISEMSPKNFVGMVQVHGNNVVRVDKSDMGRKVSDCDGLITNGGGVVLRISVADCLPLAFVDSKTGSLGLVHAGWRGLYKDIIKKTIVSMEKNFGVNPKNLIIEIGPHICSSHYEVKNDVASKFETIKGAITKVENKIFLSLSKVAEYQIRKYGVPQANIHTNRLCTFEESSLASYRRGGLPKTNYYFIKLNS